MITSPPTVLPASFSTGPSTSCGPAAAGLVASGIVVAAGLPAGIIAFFIVVTADAFATALTSFVLCHKMDFD
jgi:hypothetical protein